MMARTPRLPVRCVAFVLCIVLWLSSGCTMLVKLPDISIGLSLFGVALAAPGAELHVGDNRDDDASAVADTGG